MQRENHSFHDGGGHVTLLMCVSDAEAAVMAVAAAAESRRLPDLAAAEPERCRGPGVLSAGPGLVTVGRGTRRHGDCRDSDSESD